MQGLGEIKNFYLCVLCGKNKSVFFSVLICG